MSLGRFYKVGLIAVLLINGCANMSDEEKYTIMGGIAGAASGIAIGSATGDIGMGGAIGFGAGLLGGYIYSLQKHANGQ